MRRRHFVFLTLLSSATLASAQTRAPVPLERIEGLVAGVVGGSVDSGRARVNDVVARLLSFDRNRDGQVAVDELPERMQPVVMRGDVGGDGAIDVGEIRALARKPTVAATARGFGGGGGYTFGDEVGVSSRTHVEGAVEDLRLASPTREYALAAAATFMDRLELDASTSLLKQMQALLTEKQLDDFKMALDRHNLSRVADVAQRVSARHLFVMNGDLAQRVEQYGLAPAQRTQAIAAVERFKATTGLGDAERSALLSEMTGILNDEERDNLRAALERRPLVKSGFGGLVQMMKDGVIRGIAGAGARDAVFRMNSPQQPVVQFVAAPGADAAEREIIEVRSSAAPK